MVSARTAAENRGSNILVIDLREVTPSFDYFILATGTSRRQMHAMSEEIDRVLQEEWGDSRQGIEGYSDSRWILLDYGDIVVHLMDEETRDYYDLDHFWGSVPTVHFELEQKKQA